MSHSFRPLLTIDSAPSAAKYACGFLALLEVDASVRSETRSTGSKGLVGEEFTTKAQSREKSREIKDLVEERKFTVF